MNRKALFGFLRKSFGRLTSAQVSGIEKILDYWQSEWSKMPIEELAYVLATVKWETAHTFQPIKEKNGEKMRYAPYYGRGLVQITWRKNYEKYGIAATPDKAMEWPVALRILFDGMVVGRFTGKKLADFIAPGRENYEAARAIVNGTDKASTIADYAWKFLNALRLAQTAPKEPERPPVSSAAQTGGLVAGGGLIAGGATNAASGGSTTISAVTIGAGLISILAPWLVGRFMGTPETVERPAPKPMPPEGDTPSPAEKIDHIDAIEPRASNDPTQPLNAAIAHRKECESALAAAVAAEAEERSKLVARLDALRTAIANSDAVQAEDASEAQPS